MCERGRLSWRPLLFCPLLALNGQTSRTRVCPLLDNSGQRWVLARDALSAYDPEQTFNIVGRHFRHIEFYQLVRPKTANQVGVTLRLACQPRQRGRSESGKSP